MFSLVIAGLKHIRRGLKIKLLYNIMLKKRQYSTL